MKALALIIEDNEDNRVLIQLILEHHGYRTVLAKDGRSGIAQVAASRPDFVLLDIQLPDMHGLDVLRAIRGDERTAQLPVVAMTSYALSGDEVRFIEAGCTGYIEKPIEPDTVMAQIMAAIDRHDRSKGSHESIDC